MLSLSLPFTANNRLEEDVVRNHFDNLFLMGWHPQANQFPVSHQRHDTFALLHAVGRDCVGAVHLLPPGVSPDGVDELRYEALTPEKIEKHLGAMGFQAGNGAQDDEKNFRLSIAGTQEKRYYFR